MACTLKTSLSKDHSSNSHKLSLVDVFTLQQYMMNLLIIISCTQSPIRRLDNRLTTWKYGKGKWVQNSFHNPLNTWKKNEWMNYSPLLSRSNKIYQLQIYVMHDSFLNSHFLIDESLYNLASFYQGSSVSIQVKSNQFIFICD